MTGAFTPERWAFEITHVLNAAFGADRFPIDIPRVAREYSKQRFPDDPIVSVQGDNLHWTAESALSATKAKLEVVTSALRQHHKRRLDAGEMAIAKDDKGEWIALDMSAEYGDSTLCDTTLAALTPSATKEP